MTDSCIENGLIKGQNLKKEGHLRGHSSTSHVVGVCLTWPGEVAVRETENSQFNVNS